MQQPKVLETPRLRLEPARNDHAAGVWNAIDRSLPELEKRMTWAASTSPERVTGFVQRAETAWQEWSGWEFVIHFGSDVAGAIGLNRYDEMWRTCNLGYWVRTDLAGRGIATEAGRAVVAFGFDDVELHRLELTAAVDNIPSQRVAEKIGFRHEGTKRGAYVIAEQAIDAHLYGLLATDPRPSYP